MSGEPNEQPVRRTSLGNSETRRSPSTGEKKKGVRRRLSLQLFGNKSDQSSKTKSSHAVSESLAPAQGFSELGEQNLPLHLVQPKSDQIIDHVPAFMNADNLSISSSGKKQKPFRNLVRFASFSDAGSIASVESNKEKRKTKRRLSLPMFKGFPKVGGYGEEEATSSLDEISLDNHSVDGDFPGIVHTTVSTGKTQDMHHHRLSLGESVSSYEGSESSYSVSNSVSDTASTSYSKKKKKGKSRSRRRLSLIFGGPGTGTIKEGKPQNMPLMRLFK